MKRTKKKEWEEEKEERKCFIVLPALKHVSSLLIVQLQHIVSAMSFHDPMAQQRK